MNLFSFEVSGSRHLGAECTGGLVDLPAAFDALRQVRPHGASVPPRLPDNLLTFLRMGEPGRDAARSALEFMARRPALPVGLRVVYLFEEVRLLPPISRPGKILCLDFSGTDENPELSGVWPKFPNTLVERSRCAGGFAVIDTGGGWERKLLAYE